MPSTLMEMMGGNKNNSNKEEEEYGWKVEEVSSTMIRPRDATPCCSISLSNLDLPTVGEMVRYLYVYRRFIPTDILKESLSRVLVDYYPLAGRLHAVKNNEDDEERLEIDCNGTGITFVEAFLDIATVDQFLETCGGVPNPSWKNQLLPSMETDQDSHASSLFENPLIAIQVTRLSCGGMIVGFGYHHCVIDAVGSAHFLHAWSYYTNFHGNYDGDEIVQQVPLPLPAPPPPPVHSRELLAIPKAIGRRRNQPTNVKNDEDQVIDTLHFPPNSVIVPFFATFTPSRILQLKKQECCYNSNCTTFEFLTAHMWRSLVRSLDLSPDLPARVFFSMNIRQRMSPKLPTCFYGNAFLPIPVKMTTVENLLSPFGVELAIDLIREAKDHVDDAYVRSTMEETTAMLDISSNLVVSYWPNNGLEDVELGNGNMPLHMGSLAMAPLAIFQPAAGGGCSLLMPLPKAIVQRFELILLGESTTGSM